MNADTARQAVMKYFETSGMKTARLRALASWLSVNADQLEAVLDSGSRFVLKTMRGETIIVDTARDSRFTDTTDELKQQGVRNAHLLDAVERNERTAASMPRVA